MLLVVLGLWASVALSRVALTVQSEPTGASVFIDGAPAGVTALRTRLPRDSRLIRVEKPGFESFEREVDLRDGPVVLDVVLETAPALVTVESVPPGAHVEIDGIAPFTAGTSVSLPTSRPLRVRMSAPGYQPWSGELTVVPGQQSFSQRLEPLPDVSPSDQLAETDVDVVAVAAPTDRTERTERAEHAPSETPDASTPDAGVATPEVTPETGRVVVRFVSEPRVGEVRIDGQRVDVSGLATELPVAAGQHRIEVSNAAHAREFEAVIDVVPDSTTVVAVEW